ncbi:hypothetical protein EAHG_05023 [Escherichia coli B671]|nr:hypothetical protein EAHG_05023 [Escherichia coli B671]
MGFDMNDWNIAEKSQDERDKINADLAASGGAYQERLRHYWQLSLQLPKGAIRHIRKMMP